MELKETKSDFINVRQLCFFLCFLLPVPKLLKAPALLSTYAKSDLLFPALAHFLLQGGIVAVFVALSKYSEKTLYDTVKDTFSKPVADGLSILFGLFFVFFDLLPILDLKQFVYTAFFDTAPSLTVFVPFFFLSAFVAVQRFGSFSRMMDLTLPIFLVSFLGIIFLSLPTADFSTLLPVFSEKFSSNATAFYKSTSVFSDTVLLFPILGRYRYQKGDGKKLIGSYALGAFFTLLFFAVFYGVFSSIAPKETYAFDKIAQYFSSLDVLGRIDLLFVYGLSVLLLYYYCLPLQISVRCFTNVFGQKSRYLVAGVLNLALLIYNLTCYKYYTEINTSMQTSLVFVFLLFAYVCPLLCFIPIKKKRRKNEK